LAPEVYTGDPISYAELLNVPITTRPRALVSVSMMLSPGLRRRLEERFDCPMLDVYSLNEAGPVAVFDPAAAGHVLLQRMLYIEMLDGAGHPVNAGERGEITLTGGFNFCLPLLRYRTGDYASLSFGAETPALIGLSGRAPVRFRGANGEWINNIDVTHALGRFPIAQFGLHQRADGSIILRLAENAASLVDAARAALKPLLGTQTIDLELIAAEDKIVQYTSDLESSQ